MIKKILKMKSDGFMGRTHFLLSMILLLGLMLIPVDIIQDYATQLKSSWLQFIVGIVIFVGGTLFVDLDDVHNSAYMLGPLSTIFTLFMQTTSKTIWTLYHGKKDRPPVNREGKPTQHRYLWHTAIIAIGLFLLFHFGLPVGNYTIFANIKTSIEIGELDKFLLNNSVLTLFIILAFMSAFIGSAMILSSINKIIKVPKYLRYILPTVVIIYIFTTTYTNIRLLGELFAFGYFAHLFEDAFSDSGVCLFFPFPFFWEGKVWKKIRLLPITVTTGGTVNTIIDLVAGVGVIILMIVTISNW